MLKIFQVFKTNIYFTKHHNTVFKNYISKLLYKTDSKQQLNIKDLNKVIKKERLIFMVLLFTFS